jgi:hypothetical protein
MVNVLSSAWPGDEECMFVRAPFDELALFG